MGVNFSQARNALQISQSQFDQLDSLDGSQDGKIEQSIFDQAKALREGQDNNSDVAQSQTSNKSLPESVVNSIKNILGQARTIWNKHQEGTTLDESTFFNVRLDYINTWDDTDGGEVGYLNKLGYELAKYYLENGSTEGFSFTGIPNNLEINKVEVEDMYDDGTNDSVEMGDGIITKQKNPDGISVSFTYTLSDVISEIAFGYGFKK